MLKTWIGFLAVSLVAVGSLPSCDSGDTIVAVNYGFDSSAADVQSAVSNLKITITSGSRSPSETNFPIDRNDAGAISSPTYKRITLSGWSGEVDVVVDAQDSSGSTLLTASKKAQLSEHSAVAAFVNFTRATPDAGLDGNATGSGGSTGSGGGSGGSGSGGSGSGGSGSGGSGSGGSGSGGSGSGGSGAGSGGAGGG